jgi:hypothetical protein
LIVPDLQGLRLGLKRTFTDYYLTLRSPGIADPTESFALCYEYLSALRAQLGHQEFMYRLDDETVHLAGQVEQDLRHKSRRNPHVSFTSDPALSGNASSMPWPGSRKPMSTRNSNSVGWPPGAKVVAGINASFVGHC